MTPAERRVLDELRKGGTNAEIAVRLGIGPETVKTHVSNMLAKLDLGDRRDLAAWREEDALRHHWLLAPLLLRPLVLVGAVAGVALLVVVVLLLLSLVGGDGSGGLSVNGVGEVRGPVAVFVVENPVEHGGSSNGSDFRYVAAALDLETGKDWVVADLEPEVGWGIHEAHDQVALVRDRLLIWTDEAIRLVTLDGQREVVPFQSTVSISSVAVSPDGSKVALSLNAIDEADSIVVLDLPSGSEVLRVASDAPAIDVLPGFRTPREVLGVERWSRDGTALSARFHVSASRNLHVILTLDGEVHVLIEEMGEMATFSADLRYAISHSRQRAERGFDSLAVTELSTGRTVLELKAGEGQLLQHIAGPLGGRFFYATLALEYLDEVFPDAPGFRGNLIDLSALEESVVLHEVELATGDMAVVSNDDQDVGEFLLLEVGRGESPVWLGGCFDDVAELEACHALEQEAWESKIPPGGRRQLVGFIWLD